MDFDHEDELLDWDMQTDENFDGVLNEDRQVGALIPFGLIGRSQWRTQDFRKGWPGNLRIMKTKRKIYPPRISPFFCPKLGEDQKKGLRSDLVWFLAQD